MRMFLICLVFVVLTKQQVIAQGGSTKITGTITDMAKQPLTGASIELHRMQDTIFRQNVVSNKNGGFTFTNLPNGSYSIDISYVGFKPYHSTGLVLDDSHRNIILPVIVLQSSNSRTLQNVTVSKKKPLIEQKIDRTIVNVDAMVSAAGSNALEVLAKSPGVMINSNDDISLNGKNNVLVLIDDRATYMSAQSLAAYLRSLPAGMLDRLELISNPPARYEANGNAIINIVLKKNLVAGFNGSVNVGYNQGVYARSNNALNVNYRVRKFNVFGNVSYSRDKNFSDQSFNRSFYNTNGSFEKQILQNSFLRYQSNGWNGRAGLDYFVSKKTTLGLIITGNTRPKNDQLTYAINRFDSIMRPDSVGRGYTSGNYGSQNIGINLNLQHKFDSTGKTLAINADALHYHNTGNQVAPVDIYLPNGTLASHEQRVFNLPSDVHIYAAKADCTLPLRGKAQIDAGIKSSYVVTEYRYDWFNQPGNSLVQDHSKSNHFRYAENINSAYVSAKKEWTRWALQTGLRIENTNANAHQFSNAVTHDSTFGKHYTSLFPSVSFLYKLDSNGNNTLVLNFSRRIGRPSYQQLNPFRFFQDVFTYNEGNPQLVAFFSQYADIRYSYKGIFGVSVTYGGGKNEIQPVTKAEGDVFVTRPINYIDSRLAGVFPHVSFQPLKWWTLNLNAVLLWQWLKGNAAGVSIDQLTNVHEIETTSQFRLSKTWSTELNLFFPGRQNYAQTRNGSVYSINAGLQKKILRGEGTIRVNATDIFNTRLLHSQTVGINGVTVFNTRNTDYRRIGFSFMYNFGKAANARKRKDGSSAEDEKGRIN